MCIIYQGLELGSLTRQCANQSAERLCKVSSKNHMEKNLFVIFDIQL